ncbi:VC2046/SO_2500 family protein [Vibrio sp. RC27]
MSIQALESSHSIDILRFGQDVGQAVHSQRRADFSLLLAMICDDAQYHTPIDSIPSADDLSLDERFAVPAGQKMTSDEASYQRGAQIAEQFNQGGLSAARLQAYLAPDALTYMPEHTGNLPEDVYYNLSEHQRQKVKQTQPKTSQYDFQLYHDLIANQRQSELSVQL